MDNENQKPMRTFASDIETIIEATRTFTQICDRSLLVEDAMSAYDSFHKVYAPMLRNYKEVQAVQEILNNFEKRLSENYPGRF
jgi:hypothetical protein